MSQLVPPPVVSQHNTTTHTGLNTIFVVSWVFCVIFYFAQYSMRSAPGIMIPELQQALGTSRSAISSVIGLYFYTYALAALVSGVLLDRVGPRKVVPTGVICLAVGAVLFTTGSLTSVALGRLLQGAGSGVAFTSAVYLATRGFPAQWLATAVGVTQCIGMLGGSLGQSGVGVLIHSVLDWRAFWFYCGGILVLIAMASLAVTPSIARQPATQDGHKESLLAPYLIVLKNPQSWLCGIVSGLMFMPTNIADMIWGIPFLQSEGVDYATAVTRISMIPLGWVIGCPLLGYLADAMGRRKPVLIGGILLMLASGAAIVYLPAGTLPPYIVGLVFGIASGAAMIPYTIIKEVNSDRVKGTATGTINFIVFLSSALATPIFGSIITKMADGSDPTTAVFRQVDMIYAAGLVVAVVLAFMIKETGTRKAPKVAEVPA